jgi:hypothetical protein
MSDYHAVEDLLDEIERLREERDLLQLEIVNLRGELAAVQPSAAPIGCEAGAVCGYDPATGQCSECAYVQADKSADAQD